MAGKGAIQVMGVAETVRKMAEYGDEVNRVLQVKLEQELNDLLELAVGLTPKDTERLADSGRLLKIRALKTQVNFRIVFGGKSVRGRFIDYAETVHENPFGVTFRNGTEKFLQKAADRTLPGIEKRLAATVKRIRLR